METRRMITAMIAAFAVFVVAQMLITKYFPAPKQTPPNETDGQTSQPPGSQPSGSGDATGPTTRSSGFEMRAATTAADVTIGGGDGDAIELELTQRGASVKSIALTSRNKSGTYVHRVDSESNRPYVVLTPVEFDNQIVTSFRTHKIRIEELGGVEYALNNLMWEYVADESGPEKVVYRTELIGKDESAPILRVTKTFEIPNAAKSIVNMTLGFENLSDQPLTVIVTQDGPVGIASEDERFSRRRMFVAQKAADGSVSLESVTRDQLAKALANGPKRMGANEPGLTYAWAALANKYFAVFVRPITADGETAKFIAGARGELGAPTASDDLGDAVAQLITNPLTIAAGGRMSREFEICAAAKDEDELAALNKAYVDPMGLNYAEIKSSDATCFCAFPSLTKFMTWLLGLLHVIVRNYGVAIILLVILVRSVLHPLSVYQQKSMYRMQESMGRIQPKMQAIKEKFANDKVRQNQEIMKLWAEENVNPMAQFVAFIPLFLQMPILIALWNGLNTDVHLRNAPFDGWWITDLSRPDAFWPIPGGGFVIPIVGWSVTTLNLLPILMGVSMWLQQKYMPKPHLEAKLKAAREQRERNEKPATGPSPEDQIRQQQMMAYLMAVLLPVMFYKMPAGLTLYWLATNVFGIFESIRIRKQLEREKKRGPRPPKPPKKKDGPMSRFFKRLAEQAEQLQKQADEMSRQPPKKKT
jgi:YidC/Oxa1 family membrane protein insertase